MRERYNRKGFRRGKINITNAWSKVEWKGGRKKNGSAGTGRTEATDREIESAPNIERFADELKEITDLIVCCGKKAKRAVDVIPPEKLGAKICSIPHLGNQSLNSSITKCPEGRKLKELGHLSPGEKRMLRIEAVAEHLNRQIESEM